MSVTPQNILIDPLTIVPYPIYNRTQFLRNRRYIHKNPSKSRLITVWAQNLKHKLTPNLNPPHPNNERKETYDNDQHKFHKLRGKISQLNRITNSSRSNHLHRQKPNPKSITKSQNNKTRTRRHNLERRLTPWLQLEHCQQPFASQSVSCSCSSFLNIYIFIIFFVLFLAENPKNAGKQSRIEEELRKMWKKNRDWRKGERFWNRTNSKCGCVALLRYDVDSWRPV